MNTPVLERELDPEERARRAAAVKNAETLVKKLGFRPVPARPGFWWHEEIGSGISLPLTTRHMPVETMGDLVAAIFTHGQFYGESQVRQQLRKTLGI